jgi:predicted TIM-barrel fold metal-dependent hydrolase
MATRRAFNRALLGSLASTCFSPLAGCSSLTSKQPDMAVDCHAHVFLRDLPMPDRRRAPSGYDAPPEEYLRMLDANGMTHGVIVQPSFLGTDNSYLVQALHKYPQRLRGIAVVLPSITAADLDVLQTAGVVGIRLNQVGLPVPQFSQADWRNLLNELRVRHMHVQVHQLARELQPIIDPLLAADVDVVVDHFGRPDPKLGVEDPGFTYLLSLGATRRVWVKLSGAYRNGANGVGEAIAIAAMPKLRASLGLDRLIWGSDWPHTLFEASVKYAEQRHLLDVWIPDATDRGIVLSDVPKKRFSF